MRTHKLNRLVLSLLFATIIFLSACAKNNSNSIVTSDIVNSDSESYTNSNSVENSSSVDVNDSNSIIINNTLINFDNCYNFFLRPISIIITYNWGNAETNQLFEESKSIFILSSLEILYYLHNDKEIYNAENYIKVDDYVDIFNDFFLYDSTILQQWIKSSPQYNESTNTVPMSDGLGSVIEITPTKFTVDGNTVTIHYICTDTSIFSEGILTIELNENGYYYSSNYNDFLFLTNSRQ